MTQSFNIEVIKSLGEYYTGVMDKAIRFESKNISKFEFFITFQDLCTIKFKAIELFIVSS